MQLQHYFFFSFWTWEFPRPLSDTCLVPSTPGKKEHPSEQKATVCLSFFIFINLVPAIGPASLSPLKQRRCRIEGVNGKGSKMRKGDISPVFASISCRRITRCGKEGSRIDGAALIVTDRSTRCRCVADKDRRATDRALMRSDSRTPDRKCDPASELCCHVVPCPPRMRREMKPKAVPSEKKCYLLGSPTAIRSVLCDSCLVCRRQNEDETVSVSVCSGFEH